MKEKKNFELCILLIESRFNFNFQTRQQFKVSIVEITHGEVHVETKFMFSAWKALKRKAREAMPPVQYVIKMKKKEINVRKAY